ncbi:DUF4399 domain-containing protein [Hanamia caeni]|jgi:hypothetical protein|uniref:DUF4399 domain-containing protein n=1 Tax=Hanamia caeni TaxID=2294116 RepID=A0A3M9N4K7_9BACT|nr:DUF4399 domain-containing protein [Hanamia caeni]RNI32712.1 DUF4399 domain-containing protein [Hanamia caeni]
MKKILVIPAILLSGLIACNSGNNSETTTTTDSSATDTSHASMDMSSEGSLPAVPDGATVFFKNLKDGQTVSSPVKVEMSANGISVDSAGAVKPNSGHFHILIDAEDSIPAGQVIAKDSSHLHFGNAQQEASLTLAPGKHKLALQFADGAHRSYGNKLDQVVSITVK